MALVGVAIGVAAEANLRVLQKSLAHRGEGVCTRIATSQGGAAVLHRRDALAQVGDWIVAFDGLLFDRDGSGSHVQEVADLVAARGAAAISELRGEFTVVLLDVRSNVLHLARDPIGTRPLFYSVGKDCVLAASEPHAIRVCLGGAVQPNRLAMAQFLLGAYGETSLTLDRRTHAVPPGSVVTIDRGAASAKRYFTPRVIAPPPDAEVVDDFRDALRRAVTRRLAKGSWLEVSGGLDSTAVATIAAPLLGSPPRLVTASFPGLECDEMAEVSAFGAALNARVMAVDPRDSPERFSSQHTTRAMPDVYFIAYHNMLDPVWRGVAEHDGRVVLTGFGADQYIRRVPSEEVADAIRRADPLAVLRASLGKSAFYTALHLLGGARRAANPARVPRSGRPRAAPWLNPQLASDAWAAAEAEHAPRIDGIDGQVNRLLAWTAFGPANAFSLTRSERHEAHVGIERRHPFLDVDLIERVLGYPQALRAGTGRDPYKPLLRRAFGAALPQPIRERARRTLFTPFVEWWWRLAHQRLQQLVADSRLAELQIVTPDQLPAVTERPHRDLRLLEFFALEEWLRACESER